MRDILLDDGPSAAPRPDEPGKTLRPDRRQFLCVVGLAGVGLALAPGAAMAQRGDFARWRDTVNGFVYSVCNDRRAQTITSQLDGMSLEWRHPTREFHYYYSASVIYVGTLSPVEVICGNGFEVNRFPFYDARCPCESVTDLNAFEIRRVINAVEINHYGCVLAPLGRRTSLEYADLANYRRTAASYNLDPDLYMPEYKRVFRGKGRAVYGFQIADRSDMESKVAKPRRDFLLSSYDI